MKALQLCMAPAADHCGRLSAFAESYQLAQSITLQAQSQLRRIGALSQTLEAPLDRVRRFHASPGQGAVPP